MDGGYLPCRRRYDKRNAATVIVQALVGKKPEKPKRGVWMCEKKEDACDEEVYSGYVIAEAVL